MMQNGAHPLSTGIAGLDTLLGEVMPGDNFVWEVDYIKDYVPVVAPLLKAARDSGRELIYFRFARHQPLIEELPGVTIYEVAPSMGFEAFLTKILQTIRANGSKAFYLFDCLSDLASDWYSDRMLANFFMIVCPAVYEYDTIGYFGLLRNYHSWHATEGIHDTAQTILEIYRTDGDLYIHPIKIYDRITPTMYALQAWRGDELTPVTSSAILSEILTQGSSSWIDFTMHRFGVWTRTYMEAAETLRAVEGGKLSEKEATPFKHRLIKMAMTRDPRFLELVDEHFNLGEIVHIMKRMIGTGLIGGKSLGMLLARAILNRSDTRWAERLEVHDSFLIGSDVFYTYLVKNKAWRLKREGEDVESILSRAEEARKKVLEGDFPQYIENQFEEMLSYFGQAPIIVRSSSLLEDAFGSAFSGKYESVFCANQGTPRQRLQAFMEAARVVYASTMSKDAILYRLHHDLYEREEQMGLLVQRVSGEMHGTRYFPQVAGVGYSFNPYVWSEHIDPKAGVLRVVFGLGTRAVDRTDDDYTRLVALNAPQRRPETDFGKVRQFSQKRADVLDLTTNELRTVPWRDVAAPLPDYVVEHLATCDEEILRSSPDRDRKDLNLWTITFDELLNSTPFAEDMRALLRQLESVYGTPVDIEFTANLLEDGRYRLNLLQCRPFQAIRDDADNVVFPEEIVESDILLHSHGPVIGTSRQIEIDRLIYVVPGEYSNLPTDKRYTLARLIGQLTHLKDSGKDEKNIALFGPGRWGTSMPQLGIPVTFAEISPVTVLCEVAAMHEGLIPDVSLGTHFLNDLVELNMLCLAVFPENEEDTMNTAKLLQLPNRLTDLIPGSDEWAKAIHVIEPTPDAPLHFYADALNQRALLQKNP
jgi:pyruvate, water dikinase